MDPESVVRLVVPKAGITVALLEGSLVDSEAPSCHSLPSAAVHYVHKSPTRSDIIPRPKKSRIPTREVTVARSLRPRVGGEELRPKSSRRRFYSDKARTADIRCVTNFTEYFEKIKGRYTCAPTQCPSLKQRYDRHIILRHSPPPGCYSPAAQRLSSPIHLGDRKAHLQSGRCGYDIRSPPLMSRYTSPVASRSPERYSSPVPCESPRQHCISPSPGFESIPRTSHYVSPPSPPTRDPSCCLNKQHPSALTSSSDNRNYLPSPCHSCLKRQFSTTTSNTARFEEPTGKTGRHSAQTNITFTDLGEMKIKIEPNSLDCCENRTVPLTRTETHDVLNPKCTNYYRNSLQDAIKQWLVNVPFHPNLSTSALLAKDKIVNELINKIYELFDEFENKNYEQMVKYEIYTSLDAFNIWYPGDKLDRVTFKESMCEDLLQRIRKLNTEGFHKRKLENSSLYNDCSRRKTGNIQRRNTCESNYSLRHNVSSEYICDSTNDCRSKKPKQNKKKRPLNNSCKFSKSYMEYEILDWIKRTNLLQHDKGRTISKKEITNKILNRLNPYINKPMKSINKIVLKEKIWQILVELPICGKCNPNATTHLIRLADELADRILVIQARAERNNGNYNKCEIVQRPSNQCTNNKKLSQSVPIKANLKQDLLDEVRFCLENIKLKHRKDVETEITEVLVQNLELMRSGNDQNAIFEIMYILEGSVELTGNQILSLINCIIQNIKEVIAEDTKYKQINRETPDTKSLIKHCSTKTLIVYASEHKINKPSFLSTTTSIPEKKSPTNISRLSPEEQDYINKLSMLIKSWMETLPEQFNAKEDEEFKAIIIRDLAEDIRDQVKLHQIAPNLEHNNDRFLAYFIFRWLFRLKIFENLNDAEPRIQQLVKQLKKLPVPEMTGNRQTMKYNERGESIEFFVPKTVENLEEEISHWMNEQSSKLDFHEDKSVQNRMALDLVEEIKPRLANKQPIYYEITQWLNKILNPEEKNNVDELTTSFDEMVKDLFERIMQSPQIKILPVKVQNIIREEIIASTCLIQTSICSNSKCPSQSEKGASTDSDEMMRQFIIKYSQHNSNVHDSIIKGAFAVLLKNELQNLNTLTGKEVYENNTAPMRHEKLSPRKFNKELQYVKDISDWLKNIPIETSYNTVGNKKRIEVVNNLAKTVASIEDQRLTSPKQDQDRHLESKIKIYIDQLPILSDHKGNTKLMIDQLMNLIARRRTDLKNQSLSLTNSTEISEQSMSDFIEAYIRVYTPEIADDELASDAWSARLLEEVKKIVYDSNPNAFTKAQDSERLGSLLAPGNESLKRFTIKLDYAKEISEFLKSLPLLYSTVDLSLIISDLAEKISEIEDKKADNSNDAQAEIELANCIESWLSYLPLDSKKEIVVPIVKQQLINRIHKAKGDREIKTEGISQTPNKAQHCKSKRKNTLNKRRSHDSSDPAGMLVEAIETFSNNLPIQDRNDDEVIKIKNNVATSLFQKVTELNDSPRCYNNSRLYEDMLIDEIDLQLDILPQHPILQKQKQQLASELVTKIMEAKRIIKENAAGENYKKQLVKTIESSMPNPLPSKKGDDPGFEIYKNRLASIFILENFDNGNDAVKLKYEKRIKNEIDKYFENALNRNAIPLSQDHIYNALYSSLFKVRVPNEDSIIDEVEEVKTRCEVEDWFEKLPVREAFGVGELLEWDQKLSTLSTKLHNIEKDTPDASDKIHKEITKWIIKLPLRPGEENVDELAKKLESRLMLTAKDRKCIKVRDVSSENIDHNEKKNMRTTLVAVSSGKKVWINSQSSSQKQSQISQERPADLIIEMVDAWANQIPIHAKTPQEKEAIKEDLITKIIMKISELNDNPDVFNDDLKYDQMLDDELEKLLSTLPASLYFDQTKDARKQQLKQGIRFIKPQIKAGKALYTYKKDLKDIINNALKEPEKTKAEKVVVLNNLKDNIVDDFIEYNYNKDDHKSKQLYKNKFHDHLTNYYSKVKDKKIKHKDPLMESNQLISELSKVLAPSDNAIREEVQVIRIKNEVENLFKDLSIPAKNKDRTQMKSNLAYKLNDIENTGHKTDNDQKMKEEIIKCVKKLGKEANPKTIDNFIEKLKKTQSDRKGALSNISTSILSEQQSPAQSLGQGIDYKAPTSRRASVIKLITEDTAPSPGMNKLTESDCNCRDLHQQGQMGPGLYEEPFYGTTKLPSTQMGSIQPSFEATESSSCQCPLPISISPASKQDSQPYNGATNLSHPRLVPYPNTTPAIQMAPVQRTQPVQTENERSFYQQPAGSPVRRMSPGMQPSIQMAPAQRTRPFYGAMKPSSHQQPAGNLVRQTTPGMQQSNQHAAVPSQASSGKYLPPIIESHNQTAPSYAAVEPSSERPRQPIVQMGSAIESSGGQVEPWSINSSGAQFEQGQAPAMLHAKSRYEPYPGAQILFSSESHQNQKANKCCQKNGVPIVKLGCSEAPQTTPVARSRVLPAQSGTTKGKTSTGTMARTSSFQCPNDVEFSVQPQKRHARRLTVESRTTQGNAACRAVRKTPTAHMVSSAQFIEQPSQVRHKRENGLMGDCVCHRRRKRRRRRPYCDVPALPYCDSCEFGSCLEFTMCPGFHYC